MLVHHYCQLSVRRRKRSGAIPESRVLRCFHAPAASTWGFLLQDLSRDRASEFLTFILRRELWGSGLTARYGYSSVVFLFFPRVIPLLSGNVRVPTHLSTETPHWAVCHLPWITSTLKMCCCCHCCCQRVSVHYSALLLIYFILLSDNRTYDMFI